MTVDHPLHSWEQLLQFADDLAKAVTREERVAILTQFNHSDNYTTSDQSTVLMGLTRLLEANGDWENVPQVLRDDAIRKFNDNVRQVQRRRPLH
jgi:hypothetical protein